jgi:hypothetical protein
MMNMKIGKTKIGDVFRLIQSDGQARYFQYVANDLAQLNSDVIRVFEERYAADCDIDIADVVKGRVSHYTHCIPRLGLKLGYWTFVGNTSAVGPPSATFRISGDDGNPQVTFSEDWWVWTLGGEMRRIGRLTDEFREAVIGVVLPPDCVAHRIEYNEDKFKYPTG